MKNLFVVGVLVFLAGCATPPGVGKVEYFFGGATHEREAELVCLRWPEHSELCTEMRLQVLADAVAPFPGMMCQDFARESTEVARKWGYEELGHIYIPGDEVNDGHVATLVKDKGEWYVVDNGSGDGISFKRAGKLSAYRESFPFRDVYAFSLPYEGEVAEFYTAPRNLSQVKVRMGVAEIDNPSATEELARR